MRTIFDDIEIVKKRPGMYIGSNRLIDMQTYLHGYIMAVQNEPERLKTDNGISFDYFRNFVSQKLGIYNSEYGYHMIISEYTEGNEENALNLFFDLIGEFKMLSLSDFDLHIPTFCQVRLSLRSWLDSVMKKTEGRLFFDIKKDNRDCLQVFIENDKFVGELIVNDNNDMKPYKNVSFTICDIENLSEKENFTYCYYNDEKSTMKEIKIALSAGIDCFLQQNRSKTRPNSEDIIRQGIYHNGDNNYPFVIIKSNYLYGSSNYEGDKFYETDIYYQSIHYNCYYIMYTDPDSILNSEEYYFSRCFYKTVEDAIYHAERNNSFIKWEK